MLNQFARTELLIGTEGTRRLAAARVAIFGVGGVGGFVAEALARSGIGTLDLIDHDSVSVTNLNRQIFALHSTLGKYKVDVAKERILDINPKAQVNAYKVFYMPDTAGQFDFARYDYIVDAIDTVTGKIALIEQAQAAGTPVISSMGAGNKMNPAMFQAADLYETSVCPLARVMRRELKKRKVEHLKVVYSEEKPIVPAEEYGADGHDGYGEATAEPVLGEGAAGRNSEGAQLEAGFSHDGAPGQTAEGGKSNVVRRQTPGSVAFVPSVAGLIIAGEVVKDLVGR